MEQQNSGNKKDIVTNIPESIDKRQTAFIQVPLEFKEKVETYIKSISIKESNNWKAEGNMIDSLHSQGCFLVISLEKIEEVINGLENCLSLEVDDGGDVIKAKIKKLITLLNSI